MRDLSVRQGRQFSQRKRVLNVMEDTMLSGVHLRQRRNRRLLKWSFKAKVKCSLKRYTSELGPEHFLVLLFVKYCLDGSFGELIRRARRDGREARGNEEKEKREDEKGSHCCFKSSGYDKF